MPANTVGDSTDPEGTLRPDEAPIVEESHIFNPVSVEKRPRMLHLPSGVRPNDPYAIFTLFFTDAILAIIAQNTNTAAAQRETKLQTDHPDRKMPLWKDTSIHELKAYLGFLIYRSTCPIPTRKDFWITDPELPFHQSVYAALNRNRFEELEASLHISDPNVGGDVFAKVCVYLLYDLTIS